jgi:hypothetical protein
MALASANHNGRPGDRCATSRARGIGPASAAGELFKAVRQLQRSAPSFQRREDNHHDAAVGASHRGRSRSSWHGGLSALAISALRTAPPAAST